MPKHLYYFVSDVHLGLRLPEAPERERQFVKFLRDIPVEETEALFMLGDIWDFWYEYRDVVPKGYAQVFAALLDLMDAGVKVYFLEGNHDQWTYGYFASLGMICPGKQPFYIELGGKRFCLGHGDLLGVGNTKYRCIQWVFHNKLFRAMFSALHPRIGMGWGKTWSRQSRTAKPVQDYVYNGEQEPLWKWCAACPEKVDYFIFGHFHTRWDIPVGEGRLMVMADWKKPNWIVFDTETGAPEFRQSK